MQETRVRSPGQEDPLEKEMATHSSILAWKIPGTEGPGGLQSMGIARVGYHWATISPPQDSAGRGEKLATLSTRKSISFQWERWRLYPLQTFPFVLRKRHCWAQNKRRPVFALCAFSTALRRILKGTHCTSERARYPGLHSNSSAQQQHERAQRPQLPHLYNRNAATLPRAVTGLCSNTAHNTCTHIQLNYQQQIISLNTIKSKLFRITAIWTSP